MANEEVIRLNGEVAGLREEVARLKARIKSVVEEDLAFYIAKYTRERAARHALKKRHESVAALLKALRYVEEGRVESEEAECDESECDESESESESECECECESESESESE